MCYIQIDRLGGDALVREKHFCKMKQTKSDHFSMLISFCRNPVPFKIISYISQAKITANVPCSVTNI